MKRQIQEALDILQEECGEVIVEVSKCRRFGLDSLHYKTGIKHATMLETEVGDVLALVDILIDQGILDPLTLDIAKQAKKEYRKYTIKKVQGPDDYASMKEVVRRRYNRAINEELNLPDLIVADGGAGQMEIIRQVIEDELKLKIPIAGLAKDGKHRTNEILIGFPPQAVGLKPTDQQFKFFAGIQDEVHRFAITFHRDKRSKTQVASELDNIAGIGEKTKNDLINHFKSVKRIRMAKLEELNEIIGTNRSSIVYEHFNTNLKP